MSSSSERTDSRAGKRGRRRWKWPVTTPARRKTRRHWLMFCCGMAGLIILLVVVSVSL